MNLNNCIAYMHSCTLELFSLYAYPVLMVKGNIAKKVDLGDTMY